MVTSRLTINSTYTNPPSTSYLFKSWLWGPKRCASLPAYTQHDKPYFRKNDSVSSKCFTHLIKPYTNSSWQAWVWIMEARSQEQLRATHELKCLLWELNNYYSRNPRGNILLHRQHTVDRKKGGGKITKHRCWPTNSSMGININPFYNPQHVINWSWSTHPLFSF